MVVIYQSPSEPKKVDIKNKRHSSVFTGNRKIRTVKTMSINRSFSESLAKLEPVKINNQNNNSIHAMEKNDNKPAFTSTENTRLTSYLQQFIYDFNQSKKQTGSILAGNINVSDVLSGLARFYERIRTTVEYKGEHLLRRNAIERILKRLIWEKDSLRSGLDESKMARSLVKELIWAKYVPNNEISTGKIEEVTKALKKYLDVLESLDNYPEGVSASKSKVWVLGIASSEIEDILDPSQRDLFVDLMLNWLTKHSVWSDKSISGHEKEIQLLLAVHRSFTKSDDPTMRYYLLLDEIQNWKNAGNAEIKKFILEFPKIYEEIENHLGFKSKLILYRKLSKHSSAFEILRQVILKNSKEPEKIFEDEAKLEEQITEVCNANYKTISKRVNTGIIRSIIYIFITKVFLAILMEVPYEVYRYGDIKYIPLTINIIFPSIMMFLIGLSIKIPGSKNTDQLITRIKSICYKDKDTITKIVFDQNTSSTFIKAFGVLYGLLFLLVFGGISSLLFQIGYSLFGVIVFFFFLSLVLLFAYRVRYHAQSLKVEAEKEGILGHLFSYLMLPFLNLGFFLSRGLSQINIFTVLLDILIEAPLKSMIELFEEWISFIREKRQEVVEVPE